MLQSNVYWPAAAGVSVAVNSAESNWPPVQEPAIAGTCEGCREAAAAAATVMLLDQRCGVAAGRAAIGRTVCVVFWLPASAVLFQTVSVAAASTPAVRLPSATAAASTCIAILGGRRSRAVTRRSTSTPA